MFKITIRLIKNTFYKIVIVLPADNYISVDFPIVPGFMIMFSPFQVNVVGRPQTVNCTVSTVSGVAASSVMISWMGPGGDPVMNDSRVTISPTTSSDNVHTSLLQFTYLLEGDEGMYTCNVTILDTSGSQSYVLRPLMCKLCALFCYGYNKLTCNLKRYSTIMELYCMINHTASLIANYQVFL